MVFKKAVKVAEKEAESDFRKLSGKKKEWFVVEFDHGFEAVSEDWMKRIAKGRVDWVYSTTRGTKGRPRNKRRYFLAPILMTIEERKKALFLLDRKN